MKLKSFMTLSLSVAMAIGCSKSIDPKVQGGCSFTFKGKTYTSGDATCDGKQLKSNVLVGANSPWVIVVMPADGIVAFDYDGGASSYVTPTPAQITKSGGTVSFNVSIEDDYGDAGTINGKCTCTSGSI